MFSTLLTICSERTMRKFQYDVPSKLSHGFSKGQEARANVEHLSVVGHLQGNVSLGFRRREEQQTFHLVHFV